MAGINDDAGCGNLDQQPRSRAARDGIVKLDKELRIIAGWINGQCKFMIPDPKTQTVKIIHNGTVETV